MKPGMNSLNLPLLTVRYTFAPLTGSHDLVCDASTTLQMFERSKADPHDHGPARNSIKATFLTPQSSNAVHNSFGKGGSWGLGTIVEQQRLDDLVPPVRCGTTLGILSGHFVKTNPMGNLHKSIF